MLNSNYCCSYFFSPLASDLPGVMLSDIIMNKEKGVENVDHEYEVLDQYSQPLSQADQVTKDTNEQTKQQLSGEYELTECPAYVPIAHGNQQDSSTQNTNDKDSQDNGTYETVSPN